MKKYLILFIIMFLGASPAFASTTDYSRNWAGYAATAGGYTQAQASWEVGDIHSNTTVSGAATWVGIGGVRSEDLIQAGTVALSDRRGNIAYRAWYELLPDAMTPIPLAVSKGDTVHVSIEAAGTDTWKISFADETTNASYSTTVSYHSSLSSVEWIQEMPQSAVTSSYIPLADFEDVTFQGASAVRKGSTYSLGDLHARQIKMINGSGETIAQVSATTDQGFTVGRTDAAVGLPATRTALSSGRRIVVIRFY